MWKISNIMQISVKEKEKLKITNKKEISFLLTKMMILIYIQMEIKPIKVIVIVVKSDIDKKKK